MCIACSIYQLLAVSIEISMHAEQTDSGYPFPHPGAPACECGRSTDLLQPPGDAAARRGVAAAADAQPARRRVHRVPVRRRPAFGLRRTLCAAAAELR